MILHKGGFPVEIDDADKSLVDSNKWYVSKRKNGYLYVVLFQGRPLASLFLGDYDRKLKEIDHINGNTLDNRRTNLRLVTHGQNNINRKMPKNNKSGHKGVYWDNNKKSWAAVCIFEGVRHRKMFKDKSMAVTWYQEKAKLLHGEFFRTTLL